MTTEQWDFDRYDRDLMLYKGDFVKTLTSKREICDYLNALEADNARKTEALSEGVALMKELREYAGGYEGLQSARGYPPPESASKLGKRLNAWFARTALSASDEQATLVTGEKDE